MSSGGYFKVGLFVIVGVALGVIGIIAVGADELSEDVITFETYLVESVQGLDEGALVKARGVPMGRVNKIDFVTNKYEDVAAGGIRGMIYVEFKLTATKLPPKMQDDIEGALKEAVDGGMRIRISSAGITGAMYLEIDFEADPPPSPEISWTPENHYIPSVPSTMKQFVDKAEGALASLEEADLGAIGKKIQDVLDNANEAIDGDLARTLKGVADASEKLPGLVDDLKKQINDKLVADVDGLVLNLDKVVKEDLKKALNSIEDAGREIPKDLDEFLDSVDESAMSKLGPVLTNLEATTAELPATVANLNQTLKRIELMIAGQQMNLDQTLSNIRRITEDLQDLVETGKRQPSQLIFGKPPAPAKSVRNR
jgi:ABC-type transporter Mla subunit MlaD